MKAIKIKILEYLLDNKDDNNVAVIARNIKTNYSNTYLNIKKMSEIFIKKIGNNNSIFLKNKLTPDLFLAENNRTSSFLESEDIRNIHRKINKIDSSFFIALLFGSRLKNKNHKDLDLCIIVDDEYTKTRIEQELDTLSYNIDLNIFTSNEFKQMIELKNPNLGNEILKKNIILKGIENYYDLIKWTAFTKEK